MPIYEFFCPDNHKIYSFFARSLAYSSLTPRCPDDGRFRMERMLSRFAVTGRAREAPEGAGSEEADDPRLETAMAEVEREFSSMDPDHPDPRHVARMMRTVTHLSGEKMPEQMEEMMRRLESGEALDKLEDEFGDSADALGSEPSDEDSLLRSGDLKKIREKLPAARPRTIRDPMLYEMSEYAELPSTPAERGTSKAKATRRKPGSSR